MTKELGFSSQKWQEIFLLSITSRLAIESTNLSVQWVPGPVSLGIKLQGLELITHLSLMPRLRIVEV
jgi:hypothetical protein